MCVCVCVCHCVCVCVCVGGGVRGRLPPRGEPWKRRANVELWLNADRLILRFVWRSPERSIGKLAPILQIEVESIFARGKWQGTMCPNLSISIIRLMGKRNVATLEKG